MPRWIELLVKLLLDIGGNVFLYVELLHCLRGTVHRVLLHVLGHVRILDHGLPVSHLYIALQEIEYNRDTPTILTRSVFLATGQEVQPTYASLH